MKRTFSAGDSRNVIHVLPNKRYILVQTNDGATLSFALGCDLGETHLPVLTAGVDPAEGCSDSAHSQKFLLPPHPLYPTYSTFFISFIFSSIPPHSPY